MKPSIGRIVIYREHNSPMLMEAPAIITRVFTDLCVNLHVFWDAGPSGYRTSVLQMSPDQLSGTSWDWPKREG